VKKQVWLGVSVLVLLAVAVMPVVAEGGKNQIRWRANVFALVGEVTALDAEAGTITAEVYTGNQLIKDYVGQELTVVTDEETLFLQFGDTECKSIAFEDVAVGDYISVNGHVLEGLYVARRITVDVPLHYQE